MRGNVPPQNPGCFETYGGLRLCDFIHEPLAVPSPRTIFRGAQRAGGDVRNATSAKPQVTGACAVAARELSVGAADEQPSRAYVCIARSRWERDGRTMKP